MEYTRYFGLVLGIAGSFLTFVYSTIKKHDLKKFIEKNLQNEDIKQEMFYLGLKVDQLLTATNLSKSYLFKQQNNLASVSSPTVSHSVRTPTVSQLVDQQEEINNMLKICGGLTLLWIFVYAITR